MKILKVVAISKWSLIFAALWLVAACAEQPKGKEEPANDPAAETPADDRTDEDEERLSQAKKLFFALPSPIETASLLKKAGATYDQEVLNGHTNVSNYQTISKKALNLGVYGADLSYSSIFEQTQQCLEYIKSARMLAAELGIANAFNPEVMERFESNISDRDTVMNLISEVFWSANSSLKATESSNIAALILSGGWVEGLYIASKMVDMENPNEQIIKRIAEQKFALENLLQLMEMYEDGDILKETHQDLKELKALFDNLDEAKADGPATASVNEETGETTI
ncbi:MAG: hypothetical protein ACFB10_12530 [Salibacteraceae bacterium]